MPSAFVLHFIKICNIIKIHEYGLFQNLYNYCNKLIQYSLGITPKNDP